MKANKDNREHAIRHLEADATRLATLARFIAEHDGAEVCRMDSHETLTTEALQASHAWYFANEYGGYILCADESNEGDAIEAFGDYFLQMGYKGLIHEPEEIPEGINPDGDAGDLYENYYPYNGGEMYIDMPVVLEKIYQVT